MNFFGKNEETFRLKTNNYDIKGAFDDKAAALLLRDLVCRECITRGYNDKPNEDFCSPYDYDVDLSDMGVTD